MMHSVIDLILDKRLDDAVWSGDVTEIRVVSRDAWRTYVTDRAKVRANMSIAIQNNRLHMAQWLHETFDLTHDEVVSLSGRYLLAIVCRRGYLKMAQWMHCTFGLTSKDARKHKNKAFIQTCAGPYD
jgi:hypothetical protein